MPALIERDSDPVQQRRADQEQRHRPELNGDEEPEPNPTSVHAATLTVVGGARRPPDTGPLSVRPTGGGTARPGSSAPAKRRRASAASRVRPRRGPVAGAVQYSPQATT